jgi:imidazole glycerol-phosphate synthase subunit HisH
MIVLIDYGLGNIEAFSNIYRRLNIEVRRVSRPAELRSAAKIILPGVGAFDWAMSRLNDSGMRDTLDELVLGLKVPILGVCVGMQMLANVSEEGELPGLGWVPGKVQRFDESVLKTKTHLPHMGWNTVKPKDHPLFAGIDNPEFYFLHSYFFEPESTDGVLGQTDYGTRFASAVYRDHIFGVQFHPEKSHDWGVQLLRNFAAL